MSDTFLLGQESSKAGKKSFRTLKSQTNLETGGSNANSQGEAIFAVINCKIPLGKKKDYTPRIIPLTHKLDEAANKSILLITKDPSTDYRPQLEEKDCPTEDMFNQIYSLKRLKSIAKDPKKLFKAFKEFDIIVADNRVHKFLPQILGTPFYAKNKKLPFMIQMAKPSPTASLVKGKKSTKLKDNRCEPKYVARQMNSIVNNTNFLPPVNGNCVSIKIGYTNWKESDLLTNLNDVLLYLVDEKYKPVGGMLNNVKNIGSIFVKTGESISLPVYKAEEEGVEEENDSDFDF